MSLYRPFQALSAESSSLTEDAEAVRDLLIKRRLQEVNRLQFQDSSVPEMAQLESRFIDRYNGLLDRALASASTLSDNASSTKAT